MHKNQQKRLIQQICFMLKLSQPATSTVLEYYRIFSENVPANQYANQVIVCACVFLTSKIFQDQRKIRDILNVINSVIRLYQLAKSVGEEEEQEREGEGGGKGEKKSGNYIYLGDVVENMDHTELLASIQPTYDLTMYNSLKKKVLQTQQILLKLLKFDFSISEQKSSNYKQLLSVMRHYRAVPRNVVQVAVDVYNDLELSDQVVVWVPGILYFGVWVALVNDGLREQEQEGQEGKGQEGENGENGEKIPQKSTKRQQIRQQLQHIPWQTHFLVPLKKLQTYSDRILAYYQKLTKQEYEDEQEQIKTSQHK